jgi:hypothetical protein
MGPLVNSVLFYTTLDNTWTLPELRLVLLVGMVLSIVPIVTTSLIHRRVEPVLDEVRTLSVCRFPFVCS